MERWPKKTICGWMHDRSYTKRRFYVGTLYKIKCKTFLKHHNFRSTTIGKYAQRSFKAGDAAQPKGCFVLFCIWLPFEIIKSFGTVVCQLERHGVRVICTRQAEQALGVACAACLERLARRFRQPRCVQDRNSSLTEPSYPYLETLKHIKPSQGISNAFERALRFAFWQ